MSRARLTGVAVLGKTAGGATVTGVSDSEAWDEAGSSMHTTWLRRARWCLALHKKNILIFGEQLIHCLIRFLAGY